MNKLLEWNISPKTNEVTAFDMVLNDMMSFWYRCNNKNNYYLHKQRRMERCWSRIKSLAMPYNGSHFTLASLDLFRSSSGFLFGFEDLFGSLSSHSITWNQVIGCRLEVDHQFVNFDSITCEWKFFTQLLNSNKVWTSRFFFESDTMIAKNEKKKKEKIFGLFSQSKFNQ